MINDNVHVSSWRGSIAHLPGKRAARLPTCLLQMARHACAPVVLMITTALTQPLSSFK